TSRARSPAFLRAHRRRSRSRRRPASSSSSAGEQPVKPLGQRLDVVAVAGLAHDSHSPDLSGELAQPAGDLDPELLEQAGAVGPVLEPFGEANAGQLRSPGALRGDGPEAPPYPRGPTRRHEPTASTRTRTPRSPHSRPIS